MKLSAMPLLQNKAFKFAIALAMADSATVILTNIYGLTVILSNYPAQYLIYYLVMQTLCTTALRTIGLRFIAHNYKKNAIIQFGSFILFFILGIILMQGKAYVTPFIVAVITSGISALGTITSWSMLSLSFGMREYKSVAKYCNQASYLSSIIFSFCVPVLVAFFSINSLLVITIASLACSAFAIYRLPIQKIETYKEDEKKKIKSKPIKFPLYYYMMVFSILIATIGGVAQYTVRLEAAEYFSHAQLGSFFGYFSGVTNILGFLVAATSNQMLKRFGLKGLLNALPLLTLLCSLIVVFAPSFWSIVVLAGIRIIFAFSYSMYSTELTLNILPPDVRFSTKANIKSTSNIASMLLLVAFTIGKTDSYTLSCIIPILCTLALLVSYKVTQYYKITLQQESAFKRYNLLEEITPATQPILKEIALSSIRSKDTYTIFYGLDLLSKIYTKDEPPEELYSLLNHKNPAIRTAVISFLTEREVSPDALPFLTEHLPKETDKQIQFKVIEEIAYQNINAALQEVKKDVLDKDVAPIIENLYLLNSNEKDLALEKLKSLSQDPDPQIRKMIASIIGSFKIEALTDTLKKLIMDPEPSVNKEALRSAQEMPDDTMIQTIISLAVQNKQSLAPQLTLIALGKSTLPYLASEAFEIKNSKTIIQTIAAIPDTAAEQVLLSIIPKGTVYVRSLVAKYVNNRACKQLPSADFKAKAHELIREECCIIYNLQKKLAATTAPQIQKEIQLRITSAKVRFLQWLATVTRPREVNRLMSSLIKDNQTQTLVLDKAIELLEIYIEEPITRHYVDYIFENKALGNFAILSNDYPDSWLEHIMNDTVNQSSLSSVVFELRAVQLFQDLPAEVLLALAEEVQYYNYEEGEVIFSKDDKPDGLYCVSQGEVSIVRDNRAVATINSHGFFGELALLDESPRVASAIAKTPCTLLYVEKDVFNRIADDVTDVLRAVVKVTLGYARTNLEHVS